MKPPCNKIEKKGKSLFRCRAIRRAYRGRMSKQESNFGLTFYLRNNNKKKKRKTFSKKTFLISRFRKSWPSFKSNCDADSLITINSNVFQWEDKSSHLWHNQVITIPPMSIRYDRNFSLFWWLKTEETGR
jgi:gluconate kinase